MRRAFEGFGWVVVGALLGCGGASGSSGASTAQSMPTGAFAPAPLYAALFETGRHFAYSVYAVSNLWDPEHEDANDSGYVDREETFEVLCNVDESRTLTAAAVSYVSCDDDRGVVDGTYVATPEGLWVVGSAPQTDADVAGAIAAGHFVIPASPEPEEHREETEEGGSERTVSADAEGGWCVAEFDWYGDEGGTTRCFAEGRGIYSANWMWAGGSTEERVYSLQPAP